MITRGTRFDIAATWFQDYKELFEDHQRQLYTPYNHADSYLYLNKAGCLETEFYGGSRVYENNEAFIAVLNMLRGWAGADCFGNIHLSGCSTLPAFQQS